MSIFRYFSQIFGSVAQASVDESEEEGIHQYNNFSNFFNALLLMMRVITGENWQDVMLSCLKGAPCDSTIITRDNETCGNDFSYVFFPSFYFISTIMVCECVCVRARMCVTVYCDSADY